MQKKGRYTNFLELIAGLFFLLTLFLAFLHFFIFNFYPIYTLTLIGASVLAGVAIGNFLEKKQLNTISKKGANVLSLKQTLIIIVFAGVGFFFLIHISDIFGYLAPAFFSDAQLRLVRGVLILAIFPSITAAFFMQTSVIKKWERKNGKQVLYDSETSSMSVYAVSPEPPTS
jgi:hypothetical protein